MKTELKSILAGNFYTADFSCINELIRDAANYIMDVFRDDAFDKIIEEYNLVSNLLSRVVDVEKQRKSVDFLIGRYIGIIEMTGEVLLRNKKKEKINNFVGNLKVEDLPHFNDIIITVAENPSINHQKLADAVGISKGSLTPIMEKLVESGLITFIRPGKFKYYYLTSQGDKYYKDKSINICRIRNKDALFEDLLFFVENSDNPSKCVGEITSFLFNRRFKSNEFKEKNKKQKDPLDILSQEVKIQSTYINIENRIQNYEVNKMKIMTSIEGDAIKKHVYFSNNKDEFNDTVDKSDLCHTTFAS